MIRACEISKAITNRIEFTYCHLNSGILVDFMGALVKIRELSFHNITVHLKRRIVTIGRKYFRFVMGAVIKKIESL